MNNYQIIALILTSSVLSAFITVCFQWIFKFLDYRLDYKKKVIDKRINAYENINSITWQLGFITQDGEKAWSAIFSSKNYFDNFVVELILLRKNQIWLSERLVDKLLELNVFLTNIQNLNNPFTDEEYIALGIQNFLRIREFRVQIENIYRHDFSELYKVNKFLKNELDREKSFDIYKSDNF